MGVLFTSQNRILSQPGVKSTFYRSTSAPGCDLHLSSLRVKTWYFVIFVIIQSCTSCRTPNVILKGVDLLYSLLSNYTRQLLSSLYHGSAGFWPTVDERICWRNVWRSYLVYFSKNHWVGVVKFRLSLVDNTFTSDGALSRHIVTEPHLFCGLA